MRKVASIFLCLLMFLSGCVGNESPTVEESSVNDCQIIPEGEFRMYDETGFLGLISVLESKEVTENASYFWSDYIGDCFIVSQTSTMKKVGNSTYGPYIHIVDGETFNDHRVIFGTSSNPVRVSFYFNENSEIQYANITGILTDNESIIWTEPNPDGTPGRNHTWVPCNQCFKEESIGTFNLSTQLYTDSDGSTSYSDDDGDGVADISDLCPSTPTGESVDTDGCSQTQLDESSEDDQDHEDNGS